MGRQLFHCSEGVSSNGNVIDNRIDIENKLKTSFVNVGNTLTTSIPTPHKHPYDCKDLLIKD